MKCKHSHGNACVSGIRLTDLLLNFFLLLDTSYSLVRLTYDLILKIHHSLTVCLIIGSAENVSV